MPTRPTRSSATARSTTPGADCGCHSCTQAARRAELEAVEHGAEFEDEKEHGGKDQQAADEAPARVQEEFVERASPALAGGRAAGAGDGFVAERGAVVAVGMDFFGERGRRASASLRAAAMAGARSGNWASSAERK